MPELPLTHPGVSVQCSDERSLLRVERMPILYATLLDGYNVYADELWGTYVRYGNLQELPVPRRMRGGRRWAAQMPAARRLGARMYPQLFSAPGVPIDYRWSTVYAGSAKMYPRLFSAPGVPDDSHGLVRVYAGRSGRRRWWRLCHPLRTPHDVPTGSPDGHKQVPAAGNPQIRAPLR